MVKFGAHHKREEPFEIGVERGANGFSAAWCLNLPGCYVLVPPGGDLNERAGLAILEFMAWSHQRSADRLTMEPEQIAIAQVLDTGEDLRAGDTSAFFIHDAEPPAPREFPMWANAHDLALDELRELALSIPAALLGHALDQEGRTPLRMLEHAAGTERYYAQQLQAGTSVATRPVADASFRELQDAHMALQQAVCDVPPELRVRRATSALHPFEEWTVRKVMRRSTWHLRYHTWELRRAVGRIWLD